MMFWVIVIAATIAVGLWYLLIKPLSFWEKRGVKQSSLWKVILNTWKPVFKRTSFNDMIYERYNINPGTRYSGFYDFGKPVLLLRDPELIKQLTVKDFDYFTDHSSFVDPDADPLWSNALLSLKGDRWKGMRNTLSPTFTSSKMKSIYNLMLQTTENFVKYFLEKDDTIIEVEMKDAYSRFTNDIIATTAFGVEVNSLKDQKNAFYLMGKKLTNLGGSVLLIIKMVGNRMVPKLFKYLGIPLLDPKASKYFSAVIKETIHARESNHIVRNDMLHLMLEARNDNKDSPNKPSGNTGDVKITDAEITSQAMIFFFAGFDTVSTAMSFGSYELALNKEIQDRLRREINETQKEGKATYDDLMHMKYMDMVVSEILRKWPPFPNSDRVCTKPYVIEPVNSNEKPVPIPINLTLWLPVYGLHRDPKYFPNPDKFDPERFSEDNKNNIVPYTYMPFGVGPRICIGNRFALMEIKALLFNLLLNYEIVPTKKTQIPLKLSNEFSQIPVGGLWLGLKKIKT